MQFLCRPTSNADSQFDVVSLPEPPNAFSSLQFNIFRPPLEPIFVTPSRHLAGTHECISVTPFRHFADSNEGIGTRFGHLAYPTKTFPSFHFVTSPTVAILFSSLYLVASPPPRTNVRHSISHLRSHPRTHVRHSTSSPPLRLRSLFASLLSICVPSDTHSVPPALALNLFANGSCLLLLLPAAAEQI